MLIKETERNFIVYPSWAELDARWSDLPRYCADPLNSGFVEKNFDYRRFGYPEEIQPYELIDGPEGGGIIMWRGDPYRGRWLPLCVVIKGANLREPNGVRGLSPDDDSHAPSVTFLEPYETPLWLLEDGKRLPVYNTSLSYENADAAGEGVHWIVRYRRPKGRHREIRGLQQIPDWSRAFAVEVRRLDDAPAEVLAESAPWFAGDDNESAWYSATCADSGLGFHFAVLIYVGNHLRHVAGAAMDSMHLVARIEGRPNFRCRWNRWNRRKRGIPPQR
jgi:hypothetical protein